jgi:polyphosphate kinase
MTARTHRAVSRLPNFPEDCTLETEIPVATTLPEEKKKKKKKDKDKKSKDKAPSTNGDAVSGEAEHMFHHGDVKAVRHKIDNEVYEKELARLQIELVKMQEWIKAKGLKVVVIFEGRDAAGKGGVIKRITESLNPRICRVVALGSPTEREKTSWYFQRYASHLPSAGEMVLFDRSWYNRAGVEHVMGFCTEDQYKEFLRSCPEFEQMLIRSGIILVKYWFSVSDAEQERRFQGRMNDRTRSWKLSPMDIESRSKWVEYSMAKDAMFRHTDTKQSPWRVVKADNKKTARLNCIRHLLSIIPYEDLTPTPPQLPPRPPATDYVRPPLEDQTFVPEHY